MSTIKKVHRRKPTAIAGKTLKPIEQSLAELKAETAREKEKRVDRNAIPKQTKKANRQKRRSKPSASKQSVSELLQQVVQRTNASSTSSVSNGEDCSSTIGVPEGRLQHSIAERRDSWDSQDASSTCYSGTNSEDDEDSLGDSTFPGLHHHNHHHHHHNHHGRDPPTNRSMDSNSSTISSYRTLGAHGGKAYLGSTSLDGSSESSSVYTARTMMTNRELLSQIALRAERRQAPPAYVPRMDELLAAQISWDKKPLPPGVDRSKPPINIIPCMHPIELILAKADLRTRKRHRTLRLRAQKEEEKVRAIDASIQHKFGRAERYAAIAARINRQRRFMVVGIII